MEPLEDGRSASGRQSTDVIEQGGQERETVTDEAYEGHSIPLAVTNALADHVRVTEMFRSVEVGGSTTPADLHLTGRLRSFGAVRDYQPGTRAFLAAGGLVPLLVAANTDTNYDADVRIDNIRLFRPSTGAVLWKGEVTGTISGKTTVAASDRVNVEDYANVAVKDAVNKLLTQLSQLHIADVTALTNTPAGAGNAQ
ncbi:MAG: hypothetical protein ACRDQZ_10150 [Mycobacteriales bacterium]